MYLIDVAESFRKARRATLPVDDSEDMPSMSAYPRPYYSHHLFFYPYSFEKEPV